MKQFALGVLVTVVAGITLFLAQRFIERQEEANDLALKYVEFAPGFLIDRAKTQAYYEALPELPKDMLNSESRVEAQLITVENVGEKPITDQRLVVKDRYRDTFSKGVLDFQNDIVPGGDDNSTKMRVEGNALVIDYSLLDAGEFHRFWVVKDRYADLQFSARKPGMVTSGWDVKVYHRVEPEDSSLYYIFGALAAVLASLVAGALLVGNHMRRIVEAQGFDHAKFVRDGEEAIQTLKKAKATSDG